MVSKYYQQLIREEISSCFYYGEMGHSSFHSIAAELIVIKVFICFLDLWPEVINERFVELISGICFDVKAQQSNNFFCTAVSSHDTSN